MSTQINVTVGDQRLLQTPAPLPTNRTLTTGLPKTKLPRHWNLN